MQLPMENATTQGRAIRRIAQVLTGLCVISGVAVIWLPPYLPSQDAPNHLFTAMVLVNPDLFGQYFELGLGLSGASFDRLPALFGAFMPMPVAAKVSVSIVGSLFVSAFVRIARVSGGSSVTATAVSCAVFVGWLYAMGFFGFLFGLSVALHAYVSWLQQPRNKRRLFLVAFLLVLACSLHIVATGLVIMQLLLTWVLTKKTGAKWRDLSVVPGAVAYAACVTVAGTVGQNTSGAAAAITTYHGGPAMALSDYAFAGFGMFTHFCLAPVTVVTLALLLGWVQVLRGRTGGSWARVFLICAAVWAVVFVLTPIQMPGWAYVRPRLLPFVYALPLCAFHRGWGRGLGGVIVPLACVLSLGGSVAPVLEEGRIIEQDVSRYSGEGTGVTFSVVVDPYPNRGPTPYSRPHLHTTLYGLYGGGVSPSVFATNTVVMPIVFREAVLEEFQLSSAPTFISERPCNRGFDCSPYFEIWGDQIAVTALSWDSVLFSRTPQPIVNRLIERGYEPVAPRHLVPRHSAIEVVIDLPTRAADCALLVQAGYSDTGVEVGTMSRPASPVSGHSETFVFDPVPSGPTDVRVLLDCNANGLVDSEDVFLGPPPDQGLVVPPGDTLEVRLSH